jgi:co-chaperonin GroES (HSP10)
MSEMHIPVVETLEGFIDTSECPPFEYKCVVLPEVVKDTTAGGIALPASVVEQEQLGTTYATLCAVGGNAFEGWRGRIPKIGERVMIAKYAGLLFRGKDGREYRLINDKDLGCAANW